MLSYFVISSLTAEHYYVRSQSEEEPYLQREKKGYYGRILSQINSSIALQGEDTKYLSAKADYLLRAVDSGLGEELSIKADSIEKLLQELIKLNPVNYEYHLKLGWFYRDSSDENAEKALLKARQLYPLEHQVYLYLAKYYFRKGGRKETFKNLILFYYYSNNLWKKSLDKLQYEIENNAQLAFIDDKWLTYTFSDVSGEFVFKEEGFPHVRLGMQILVYTNPIEQEGEVTIYKGNTFSDKFKRIKRTEEFAIYRFYTSTLPQDIYLDELKISAALPLSMEKIECLR